MKNKIILAATMLSLVSFSQNSSFKVYAGTNTKYDGIVQFFRNYPVSDVNYGVNLDVDLYKNTVRFGGKFENLTSFKPFTINKTTITNAKPNVFVKYIMPEKNNTNFDIKLSADFHNQSNGVNSFNMFDSTGTQVYISTDFTPNNGYYLGIKNGGTVDKLEVSQDKIKIFNDNKFNKKVVDKDAAKIGAKNGVNDYVIYKYDVEKFPNVLQPTISYVDNYSLDANVSTLFKDVYKFKANLLGQISVNKDENNKTTDIGKYAKLSLGLNRDGLQLNDYTTSNLDFKFNIDNGFSSINAGFNNIYFSAKMDFANEVKLPKTILSTSLISNTNINNLKIVQSDYELYKSYLYNTENEANYNTLSKLYSAEYAASSTANDQYDTDSSEFNLDLAAKKIYEQYNYKISMLDNSIGNLKKYGQYVGLVFGVNNTSLKNFEFNGDVRLGYAHSVSKTNATLTLDNINKFIPEINFGLKYKGVKNANIGLDSRLVYEYTGSSLKDNNTNGLKIKINGHADYTSILVPDKLNLVSKMDLDFLGVGIAKIKKATADSSDNKGTGFMFYKLDLKPSLNLVYTPIDNLSLTGSLNYTRIYIQSDKDSTFNLMPSNFGINFGLEYKW